MPLGPYKDFAACQRAMTRRYGDVETAKKVCGKMQARMEQRNAAAAIKSNNNNYLVGQMPGGPEHEKEMFDMCVRVMKRDRGMDNNEAQTVCEKMDPEQMMRIMNRERGRQRQALLQIPASLRAPLERSQKALKFLEESNALVNTSLQSTDSQSPQYMISEVDEQQEESYTDKVTRIMDEYGVDEPTAVEVVNRLIKTEQEELAQQQLEIQKEIELQKRLSEQQQGEGQEPLVGRDEQPQQQQTDDNVDSNIS